MWERRRTSWRGRGLPSHARAIGRPNTLHAVAGVGLGALRPHSRPPLVSVDVGQHEEEGSLRAGEMADPKVAVFFYGSYMNRAVLKEAGLAPEQFEVAKLTGFEIEIRPLANLTPSDTGCTYGLLTLATHEELERLYAHAREVLCGTYLPRAVVVEVRGGGLQPALCYIAPSLEPRPAANEYIDRVVAPARQHGFPLWYLERLESFRSGAGR